MKDKVIDKLLQCFQISKVESKCFKYLGLSLEQKGTIIHMNQMHYTRAVQEIDCIDKEEIDHLQILNRDNIAL